MMYRMLSLLFLFLIGAPSVSQSRGIAESAAPESRYRYRLNPCLYNREDYLPCSNAGGVVSPGPNQYTVHATRFQRNYSTGRAMCIKRKRGELLRDVEDLSSPRIKFLFSPGAEQSPPVNYVNQMLVEYNIVCETGLPAFIQFEALNLEPINCEGRCRDYIEIDTGTGGRMEFCGNNKPSDPIIVENGRFTLKLRTSFYYSYPGFRVFVTCVSNRSIDPSTCRDHGGSFRKRHAPEQYTLDDPYVTDDVEQYYGTRLTSAEKKSLKSMAEDLFDIALSQARRKISSWPPPSYSLDDPNDIRVLSELNLPPTLPPPTQRPPSRAPPTPSYPSPRHPFNPGEPLAHPLHKRTPILPDTTVHLNFNATLEAVRSADACNPVLHTVSASYLTIARRLDPVQVQAAQLQFQAELAASEPSP